MGNMTGQFADPWLPLAKRQLTLQDKESAGASYTEVAPRVAAMCLCLRSLLCSLLVPPCTLTVSASTYLSSGQRH